MNCDKNVLFRASDCVQPIFSFTFLFFCHFHYIVIDFHYIVLALFWCSKQIDPAFQLLNSSELRNFI